MKILILFLLMVQRVYSQESADTNDCDISFGCFRIPSGCNGKNCDYIVKWKDDDESTFFLIGSKSTTDSYLAIAFSTDESMGNDDAVICFNRANGQSDIQHFFNMEGYFSQLLKQDEHQVGLSELKVSFEDNFFTCSFKRKKSINLNNYFDLKNQFYLLVAKGSAFFQDSESYPDYHFNNRYVSSTEIDFSQTFSVELSTSPFKLAKAHGVIMLFSWMFLSTLGILFARYYKYLHPNKTYFGVQLWFAFHRPIMVSVPLLSLIGLLLILISKDWTWTSSKIKTNFSHSIIGILTIGLSVIQPIYAVFRPDKDAPNRSIFNWVHRMCGILTYILSIVSIFLGSVVFFRDQKWAILYGWIFWLIILIFLLEITEHKIRSNNSKISNKVMEIETNKKSFFDQSLKSFLLAIHIVVSSALALTMIIFISTVNLV